MYCFLLKISRSLQVGPYTDNAAARTLLPQPPWWLGSQAWTPHPILSTHKYGFKHLSQSLGRRKLSDEISKLWFFFPMATTIPWVKDGTSAWPPRPWPCVFTPLREAARLVSLFQPDFTGGVRTKDTALQGLCKWLPVCVLFRHPRFLLCDATLESHTAKWSCSRLNVSGNLTRPSPTSPHCRLSAHPKSLLEFRKVETKACFDSFWNTLLLSAESSSLRVVLKRGGSESNYCPSSPLNNKTAFLDNLVKVQ